MRWTESAADGMIDKRCARWRNFAHDVVRRADDQCRNALAFDDMSYETDGLVAEGSIGNQQGQIDFSFFQFPRESRSELGFILFVSSDARP